MLNQHKFKLTGRGIIFTEAREWLEDNVKVTAQAGEFHEVVDDSSELEEKRLGWIILSDLQISSDFTMHTKKGMRGESFVDNFEQVLLLDQYSKLDTFTQGELVDVETTHSQELLDRFMTNKFQLGKHYRENWNNKEPGVIFVSQKPERVIIQTSENSVRIGGEGVFVLDREKESLVLISDQSGITVISDGESMVEINDGIIIDGKEFNPACIVNHITESISHAFSDLKHDFDFDFDFDF